MDIGTLESHGNGVPRRSDDRGATAVEYALLVALIATVIAVAVGAVGVKLVSIFTGVDF